MRIALLIVITTFLHTGCASRALDTDPTIATFSIVAWDEATGELGIAVQSKVVAAASIVPFAQAGVGAIATQANANVSFGPEGLQLLSQGLAPQAVIDRLVAADEGAAHRQLAIVDAQGRVAAYTGSRCMDWAGHQVGRHYSVQGNILAGQAVVADMAEAFESAQGDLGDRMIAALEAAQAAGGDRRGRQAAGLYIVRKGAGYGGRTDKYRDIRVDDHKTPIAELKRIYAIHKRTFLSPEELAARDR